MVTEREIYEAAQDIPAIRSYLSSLDPTTPIRVGDPCACVYHGYLFHRFPNVRHINIYSDNIRVQEEPCDNDIIVPISCTFADVIQGDWIDWARHEGEGDDIHPDDRTLTAAQCIEELDELAKEYSENGCA